MVQSSNIRYDGRNGEVWRRYAVYGWTQERIAQHFDLTNQRVSQIISAVREGLKTGPDAKELIEQSHDFLKEVQARAMEIADMAGAPVAVGKDGEILVDPDTGEVVRDYSGRLRALETAAKMDAQMAKRFGLDAPEKVEHTARVKYEIVDVPTSDLT